MTELDRILFWEDFPQLRVVTINRDGQLRGGEPVPLKKFGGSVPNVGDIVGVIWDDKDYEFQYVQRRMFIDEHDGPSYWLIIVRDGEPSPLFDAISTSMLLVTDLERAIERARDSKAKRDLDEVIDRSAHLHGQVGKRRYKPKSRLPRNEEE